MPWTEDGCYRFEVALSEPALTLAAREAHQLVLRRLRSNLRLPLRRFMARFCGQFLVAGVAFLAAFGFVLFLGCGILRGRWVVDLLWIAAPCAIALPFVAPAARMHARLFRRYWRWCVGHDARAWLLEGHLHGWPEDGRAAYQLDPGAILRRKADAPWRRLCRLEDVREAWATESLVVLFRRHDAWLPRRPIVVVAPAAQDRWELLRRLEKHAVPMLWLPRAAA